MRLQQRSSAALLLAIALIGVGCQPAAVPAGATKPKKTTLASDPIPPEPIQDRTTATPRPEGTPAPTPAPAQPPVVTATPTPTPAAEATATPTPASPALLGLVTAPAPLISSNGGSLISNNGGGLISDRGGSLISNNGGGLIGNNAAGLLSDRGGSLISNNGGGLISNNGGGYRVLAVGSSSLPNAFLYLTNRDEKFFFNRETNQVFSATSDASGRYQFPITSTNGFPVGKDVVVNVLLNDNQRLTGYMVPGAGLNELQLNLATTLATEYLRGDAYRRDKALGTYDAAAFRQVVSLTQSAIESGMIGTWRDDNGQKRNVFELSMQHVDVLRHQVAVLVSVVEKTNATIKAISDQWKQLLGERPAAVTTLVGSGAYPKVDASNPLGPAVEGDWRGGQTPPVWTVPIGACKGVAIAQRGDVFVATDGPDLNDAHIRWIKPDGSVHTIWLPNFLWRDARGLVVEKEPSDDPNHPGSLLVAGGDVSLLWRVYMVDAALKNPDGSPKFPTEIVSGLYSAATLPDPAHPGVVDGDVYPPEGGSTPVSSYWRLYEEGPRTYRANGQPVPNPARYAHLGGVVDVAVDELGNIYLAEVAHHRVRMIAGAGADGQTLFGYRTPQDTNQDGVVDGFGPATAMQKGCLYTIVGNPAWDAARTPVSGYGRWFGAYGGDGGPAQQAKLDAPSGLAFKDGYLYIADSDNQRIRRVSRATGTIETVAGNPGGPQTNNGTDYYYPFGYEGDGGPALQAQLAYPAGLAVDAKGRLFIADTGYGRIRMVDTDGRMGTVAGRLRYGGDNLADHTDDGEATAIDLAGLNMLAIDPAGNVVFTDKTRLRLRKLWRQWE